MALPVAAPHAFTWARAEVLSHTHFGGGVEEGEGGGGRGRYNVTPVQGDSRKRTRHLLMCCATSVAKGALFMLHVKKNRV